MSDTGPNIVPDRSAGRALAGEVLGPEDLDPVTTPIFETASATYGWLNKIIAIGKIAATDESAGGIVTDDLFAVTSRLW